MKKGNSLKRALLLIIWFFFVSNFVFAWAVWHILSGGTRISKAKADWIINLAAMPSEFYHELTVFSGVSPSILIVKNSVDFSNVNSVNGFVLLSTINSESRLAEVEMIDLVKKKSIQTWQADFSQIDLSKTSKYNVRIIHPILFDKDLVTIVNSRYLVRLDSSSNYKWLKNGNFHHSIEMDADRNLWVCGTLPLVKDERINSKIADDAIFKIDPANGKILYQKSIYDLLIQNGHQELLHYLGPLGEDPIHINDIQPALASSKYWQKGDLLISLRHRSTVLLYRPSTNKVVWLKTGPWSFQHDCDFLNDHEIGVLGNDVVRVKEEYILTHGHNNQYIYNFETDQISTPYTKLFQAGKIKTLTEGRSRILPDGQLFVEETNYGRILFGDKNGVNGVYVSRIDKDHIAMLGWSRYYTREEYDFEIKQSNK